MFLRIEIGPNFWRKEDQLILNTCGKQFYQIEAVPVRGQYKCDIRMEYDVKNEQEVFRRVVVIKASKRLIGSEKATEQEKTARTFFCCLDSKGFGKLTEVLNIISIGLSNAKAII